MSKAFSWFYNGGSSESDLIKGWREEYLRKQEEEKNKQVIERQKQQNLKDGKNEDGSSKDLWSKFVDGSVSLGRDIVAGTQQTAGKIADASLQGGSMLDELANQMQGGSDSEKDTRRVKNMATTDSLRKIIHDQKDIKGENIGGTQAADNAAQNMRDNGVNARDVATLAGESLDIGIGATQFINPTQVLRGGLTNGAIKEAGLDIAKDAVVNSTKGMTAAQAAKFTAKDAALFGGMDATATATSTYGQTGDAKKAMQEGAKAGLLSAATQGALDTAGYVGGRVVRGAKDTVAENKSFKKNLADTSSRVLEDTKANGGATVTTDGKPVSEGYSYSPFKDAETIVDEKSFSQKDVEKFMKQHKKELSDPNNHVGSVVSDGKVKLGISRVIPDKDAAIKEAAGKSQPAIHDLSNGEEIGVGTIGDDGKYTAYADVPQKETPLALPAGFKDNAHYDAELQRYSKMEFTPEDNVWKDRQVTLKDGSTVDLNAIDKEINANARAMSDLQKQASGIDGNTGKATAPDGVDPSTYTGDVIGRTKAMEKFDELKTKNEQLTAVKDKAAQMTGVSTEMQLDPKKVRDNYTALQDEAKAAKEYNYNTSGRPVADIKNELDALNKGDVPPELHTQLPPADNIEAVKARINDPQVTQEIDQLRHDRYMLNDELSRVMTPDKAQVEKSKLDARLQEIQQELSTVPEARMQYEMESVMQEYKQHLADIDKQVAEDAPHAKDLIRVGNELDQREQSIISRANELQAARPDMFTEPDPQLVEQRKAQLQQELADAESFTQGSKIVENVVASGENLSSKVKTDGTVKQAVATDLEDIMANAKVGDPIIGMGLRSPSQLLEKMGLGKLYSNVSRAYQSTIEHTMDDIKTIAAIGKALDAEDIDGKDIINYIRGKSDTIPAKSQEVSNMVKAFFDEKRAAMESIGYKGIDNYFPEYINKEDPNYQRLFGDKENGNITFASFKHREGNLGDFNTDLVDVMRIYSQGFNKKMYLEPALKDIESIKNIKGVHEAISSWTNDYLKQLKGSSNPSEMEKIFNMAVDKALGTNKFTSGMVGGSHYRTTLADARMYTSVATMGLNPSTAIRNLTQGVNTVAEYGSKNSMVGMVQGTKALISGMKNKDSPQWLELKHAGVIEGGVARNYADELDKLILGQGKWAGRKVKAVDGMMAMIRWTDISLRAQAYYAAKAAGKAKGLTGQDLVDFASRGATKTQFNTSRLDMPVKLNGPGVRSLTQLATFSIKQTEFLSELGIKTFKDSKTGKFRIVPEAGNVSRLVQATALGAGMTSVLGPLVGFQADEFNPWNQQFGADSADKAIYRSPLVKLAIGDGKGKMGLFDVLNMNDEKTTPKALKEWWDDNWNTVIPAGSQAKKMGEGFDLVSTGESQNSKGNTRFLYDNSNSGFDNVKAILFGQYATKPGQEWLQGGMKTLSDKQTQQIQGLPHDKKQQYYDYYMSAKQDVKTSFATGRNEAVSKIKETAKSNEALARQMAEEYNAKVDKQMSSYWSKHQDMPSRLQDEMFNELRIDATKQIDSAKKRPSLKSIQDENRYAEEDMNM